MDGDRDDGRARLEREPADAALGCSLSSPVRERPPSQYMAIAPPRARMALAVMNASSSA